MKTKIKETEGIVRLEYDSAGWTVFIDEFPDTFGADTFEEILKPYIGKKVRLTLEEVL